MTRTCAHCPAPIGPRNVSGSCRSCTARRLLNNPASVAKATNGLRRYLADPAARAEHTRRSRGRLEGWRLTPEGKAQAERHGRRNLLEAKTAEGEARRRRGIRAAAYRGIPEERWDECARLATSMPAAEAKRIILEDEALKERKRLAALSPLERQLELVRTGRARVVAKPDFRTSGPAYSLVGNATGML